MIPELFDVQSLVDNYDFSEEKIIIDSRLDRFDSKSEAILPFLKSNNEIGDYIVSRIKNPKSGEIYLVSDRNLFKKFFVLYIKNDGLNWGKVLSFVNEEDGSRLDFTISESGYQAFKQTPIFENDLADIELAVFIAALEYSAFGKGDIGLYNVTNAMSDFIGNAKQYLDKGLWFLRVPPIIGADGEYSKDYFDVKTLNPNADGVAELFGSKAHVKAPNDIDAYATVVGPYEVIKKLYVSGNNRNVMIFGGFDLWDESSVLYINDYEKYIVNAEKRQQEIEEQKLINQEIPASASLEQKEEIIERKEEMWGDEMADVLKQIQTSKKKKSKKFAIESEISIEEKALAQNEAVEEVKKLRVPKRSSKIDRIPIEIGKVKEQLESASELSFPDDWDYVYSIAETSAMYNQTVGKKYDALRKDWLNDPEQKNGLTIDEWNAFFVANPQYSHLINDAIGQWGGLTRTEKELCDVGVLLYNPITKKLQYAHHYLKGNAYDRRDETVAAKDYIVAVYGLEFYNLQLQAIAQATPVELKVDDPDVDKRPFIHPLDDIISGINLKFAAGTSFPKRLNPKIMAAYKKMALEQRKARKGKPVASEKTEEEQEMIDLEQPQELNVVIFFKKWLSENTSFHLKYEVPIPADYGSDYIDAVDEFYFGSGGYQRYVELTYGAWGLINPATGNLYNSPNEISRSDFFEFRDNLKTMVNLAFQDFIVEELSSDDRERISQAFNRRYNGFIKIDVSKYPVFIRHRKYFKDRMKRIQFKLDESQINGIKFGTINNSAILAHEVGRGKTTSSIAYMSHIFETNQANNILVSVPKALFDNKKWKEEVAGYIDAKRDQYILGITPSDYNLIELGNLAPSTILDGARTDLKDGSRSSKKLVKNSSYKTYSFEDVARIEDFKDMYNRVIDMGEVEKDPYLIADFISKKGGWSDIILEAKNMDNVLYQKCKSSRGEYFERILDIFDKPATKFWETRESKRHKQITEISLNIIKVNLMLTLNPSDPDEKTLLDLMNSELDLMDDIKDPNNKGNVKELEEILNKTRNAILDSKPFNTTLNKALDLSLRDEQGRVVYEIDDDGKRIKQYRPMHEAAQDFILELAGETMDWVLSVLRKLSEYGIYEYGKWNLSIGAKNIFLVTHDALKRVGFTQEAKEYIRQSIHEFSSYQKSSTSSDDLDVEVITGGSAADILKGKRGRKAYHRDQQKALEKQYGMILDKIEENMTTDGSIGKLMLSHLSIDGFIFDEGHKGKKLFTNAVSDSVFDVRDEKGRKFKIRKSSHDITGGNPSDIAIQMFGLSQYIRSMGAEKPVMILTATPFSNQPTEIFTMTAMVGVKQLREQGIANVKNFFDLFLNETLKYSFDHNGQFVKRITVEDFRNKPLLMQVIWSVMDIKREANRDAQEKSKQIRTGNVKPEAIVLPKLTSATSYDISNAKTLKDAEKRDKEKDCEDFREVINDTAPELKRDGMYTASIVNRNSIQEQIMEDLEKVALAIPNPKRPKLDSEGKQVTMRDDQGNEIPVFLPYTFDDICPNIEIMVENDRIVQEKSADDEESEATASEVDNTNVSSTAQGRSQKKINEGRVFKTLGISQAVCLSPYFYSCMNLPEPTPESIVKLSPKIEYLVKAILSVKNYHEQQVPKQIKDTEKEIDILVAKTKLTLDETKRLQSLRDKLPRLRAALKVSGQVVYLNKVRFNYYRRDKSGKAQRESYNIVSLVRDYMVENGIFTKEEIGYVGTGMKEFGRVKKDDVETTIKDFQDGKVKVLFGTPAIKEGVDLQQNGSTLYVMTPDWNPSDMRQIEGRIWRRGNPYRKIRVVYVLLDQSVEIFIYAKLEEKSQRLKRIMKERNELLEMQEMSLDPREAQIALASDPGRRADIITKTCHEILKEKRNKLRVSVETLADYAKQSYLVTQNVENFYNDYMLPYYEELVKLQVQVIDMYMGDAQNELANNRDKFVRQFCNQYTLNRFGVTRAQSLITKVQNDRLLMGMNIVANGSPEDYNLRNVTSDWFNPGQVMEWITGLATIIRNKDKFADKTANKLALLESLTPMSQVQSLTERHLVHSEVVMALPTEDNYWGSFLPFYISMNRAGAVLLLCGGSILCMPSHLQKLLLDAFDRILAIKKFSRQEIADILRPVLADIVRDMTGIVYADDFISPENTEQVMREREDMVSYKVTLDDLRNNFPQMDIFSKSKEIKTFYETKIERGVVVSWNKTADKVARGLILKGSAALTRRSARDFESIMPAMIAPVLGLGVAEDKDVDMSSIAEIYTPISQIAVKAKEIKNNLEMVGIEDVQALEKAVDEGRTKLEKLNQAIEDILKSRDDLYVKFTEEREAKKKITMDDIINGFAQLNYILADREPEMSHTS